MNISSVNEIVPSTQYFHLELFVWASFGHLLVSVLIRFNYTEVDEYIFCQMCYNYTKSTQVGFTWQN